MTWEKVRRGLVWVLSFISVGEAASFALIRHRCGLYSNRSSFSLPTGLLADGTYLQRTDPFRCGLLRVAADSCEYCRRDESKFLQLKASAENVGCNVFLVAPMVGQVKNNSTTALEFVDLQFGGALVPYITPQTIVLSRKGKIVWDREGAMSDIDVSDALRVINRFR